MKRIIALILCILMVGLLCGCKSKVPEAIKNPNTEFIEIEEFNNQ